jgi:sugar O-acyltransferase (sialic acid O-acetyltransferase NeuD family)
MKKLVLFGNGKIADVLGDYFQRDSDYEIAAYTCEAPHVTAEEHRGRPLVPFDQVERRFPPDSHDLHIAVGYHQLNRLRERLLAEARAKGYRLPSFVSSRSWPGPASGSGSGANRGVVCGDNCFIADGVSVEPGARIGHNVALWSNVVVGHHAEIGDHCWVAGGTAIGGASRIGERCFVALNVTVGNEVEVGADSLLGARTLVTKSLPPGSVVIDRDSEVIRLTSQQFLRISKLH